MMKILHVLNDIKHSGAELMLHSSYPSFKQKDVTFTALATGKTRGSFSSEFEAIGIRVVSMPLVKSLKLPFQFFPYYIRYYRFLKREKFNVVHIHRMYLYFWYAIVAKLAGVNVVVRTVHNVFRPGRLRYQQFYLSRKILSFLGVSFTSIGPSVQDHELKFFGNKTVRINNWYDPLKFYPLQPAESKGSIRKNLSIPPGALVIISVGSCLPQKNHNHIIAASANLALKYPQLFYLHLGDGPLCREEQEVIESLNLKSNSLFAGNVNNVRDYLICSDLYVMPSDYEGLSISLLESMACGLPAVGYDVPGVRDLIEHEINGYLIPQSVDALTTAIEDLILNKEKRFTFGEQSFKIVQRDYNMTTSVDQFITLYQSIKS